MALTAILGAAGGIAGGATQLIAGKQQANAQKRQQAADITLLAMQNKAKAKQDENKLYLALGGLVVLVLLVIMVILFLRK